MKKIYLLFIIILFGTSQLFSFEKKSIVERYTNYQCGPCASLNNAWYNAVTANLLASNTITHIVYNVNWPGPADPMYLLNAAQNSLRWRYYGVNSVPWIEINGTKITNDQTVFQNTVTTGNAQFAPFKIVITPGRLYNDVISVRIKIIRDPTDVTVFDSTSTKLRIGITEKRVSNVPGALETHYYDITRRMLPDPNGILFDIPAPGDSVLIETSYIPSQEFSQSVNFDSLTVVAFIQNDLTKLVYQSEMTEILPSNILNAAFIADENMGVAPFKVNFINYSTGSDSSAVLQYEWDFNNDGTIDSQEPSPEFTYTDEGTYSVKLTVKEGTNTHTLLMSDLITIITTGSKILVVNGIDYSNATYIPEMQHFYGGSAAYGYKHVDVWDLFGDQGFPYSANPQVVKVHLFNRDIPLAVMKNYDKVIWIGNNYSGDLTFFNSSTVIDYLGLGGNFMLAARLGSSFFDQALKTYAGVGSFTGDLQVDSLVALDSNLVNMRTIATNNLVHLFTLNDTLTSIPVFKYPAFPAFYAGFRMQKENEGAFIFISGRPYRYDTAASAANYNYIMENWMTSTIVDVKDEKNSLPKDYSLSQNYPNPFNPATTINYTVKNSGMVRIKLYDVLGNELKTLVNEIKNPGEYRVNFNAHGFSSGIYFYRMTAEGIDISRKMILIK